jgi:microcompartment protein CcmL/EutN
MANATERKPTVTPTRPSDNRSTGALVSVATFAIDAGDRGASTVLGLINDARGELRTAVDTGLDAAENAVRGMFRISKRVTARVDELVAELTSASERTVNSVVRGLRDTTRAAGELAATASSAAIAGERVDGRPAAQA